MGVVLFLLSVMNFSAFSLDDQIVLGMSETEFLALANDVVKVSGNETRSHGYTEFSEENPHVYIDNSTEDKKEYYFHDEKLYKVMTIFRGRANDENYYLEKIEELKKSLGEPSKIYSDHVFSIAVLHHVWESEHEELDLRFGAGYVHVVITNKSLRRAKEKQDLYRKAI